MKFQQCVSIIDPFKILQPEIFKLCTCPPVEGAFIRIPCCHDLALIHRTGATSWFKKGTSTKKN